MSRSGGRVLLVDVLATPERAWLGEVSAVVLQQALADLNAAYRNFFASLNGNRKGPKMGPTKFRSRKDNVAKAAGLAVSACGAQVRPGAIPAQRGEAGTHPKPRREAA